MREQAGSSGVDAAGLTPEQLARLREKLLSARSETLARLTREEQPARAAEQLSEPMDAAELSREQGDAVLLLDLHRERLADIEDALNKLETGGYGVSERSGEPIGYARLDAVPWARLAADET
jgi:DnaK suppressor protein